jgi:ferredoxin, 2Fe-2S
MKACEVTFLPDGKKVSVRPGITLLDAGSRARVQIRTRCGGKASCLMCKVHADPQSGLAAPTQQEQLKLGHLLADGVRLACQTKVIGDAVVTVPEDPLKTAIRNLLAKQQEEDDGL